MLLKSYLNNHISYFTSSKNQRVIDEAIDGVYTPTDMDRTGRVKTLAGTFLYWFWTLKTLWIAHRVKLENIKLGRKMSVTELRFGGKVILMVLFWPHCPRSGLCSLYIGYKVG